MSNSRLFNANRERERLFELACSLQIRRAMFELPIVDRFARWQIGSWYCQVVKRKNQRGALRNSNAIRTSLFSLHRASKFWVSKKLICLSCQVSAAYSSQTNSSKPLIQTLNFKGQQTIRLASSGSYKQLLALGELKELKCRCQQNDRNLSSQIRSCFFRIGCPPDSETVSQS